MPESVLEILNEAKARLLNKKIGSPLLEAELILSFVLGCQRSKLYFEPRRVLDQKEQARFQGFLGQRLAGKPLQYVLGETYFFGYRFKVNQDVLIPRPETEILVEEVISLLKAKGDLKIVDLGTGCGNVAVSLALNLKDAFIFATDISAHALKVAQHNAKLHGVENQIEFLCGNLFEPINTRVDAIVTNPPYVSEEEFAKLPDEIKDFEPKEALLAGKDGLEYIRKIIDQAPEFLVNAGLLALEIGFGQETKVKELVFNSKFLKLIGIKKDLSGIPRVMLARKCEMSNQL